MPNPLMKWAKRNTHSGPPPHSSGAIKGHRDLSYGHSHPVQKGGINKYLFSAPFLGFLYFTRMSDIIPLPLKPFSVPRTPDEEFWNSRHVFVCEMFPCEGQKPVSPAKVGFEAERCKRDSRQAV